MEPNVVCLKSVRHQTGHGNATYDKFELRIHKRMIDVQADDRALRQIMRVSIPQDTRIEIRLLD